MSSSDSSSSSHSNGKQQKNGKKSKKFSAFQTWLQFKTVTVNETTENPIPHSPPPPQSLSATTATIQTGIISSTETEITIRLRDGSIYVCDRFCPHKQADLNSKSTIDIENATHTCQIHVYTFDLKHGGSCSKSSCPPLRVRQVPS